MLATSVTSNLKDGNIKASFALQYHEDKLAKNNEAIANAFHALHFLTLESSIPTVSHQKYCLRSYENRYYYHYHVVQL